MSKTTEEIWAAVKPETPIYQAAKAVLALSVVERRALEIVINTDSQTQIHGPHSVVVAAEMWELANVLLGSLVINGDMRDPSLGKRSPEEGGGG